MTPAGPFDLVIRGGHVIDPAAGIDGPRDLAVAGGRIAAVAERIEPAGAEVRQARGLYVVPGLIDLHTHVYWGGTALGIDPTRLLTESGTTTAVDAGSAGANAIGGLVHQVAALTPVRILAYLNISLLGIFADDGIAMGEAEDLRVLDIHRCARAARQYAEHVVGIKIRVGASTTGPLGAMPLHMAIRAAELAGDLPVMVHIGAGMPPRIEDIVDPLRPGDVLTHYCTPKANSPLLRDGRVRDCMVAARERGVIMDVGHGAGSFGFDVARRMLEAGIGPDVISSDVHRGCIDGPAWNVLVTMSKYLELGLPLAEVVRAATATPAAVCRRADIGTLRPGAQADITLLELREEPVVFTDSIGARLRGSRCLVPRGTVLGGRWMENAGPAFSSE